MPDRFSPLGDYSLSRLVAAVPVRVVRNLLGTDEQSADDFIARAALADPEVASYLRSERVEVLRLAEASVIERWN